MHAACTANPASAILARRMGGSHRGRVRPPAKRVGGDEPPRGFESRSLRHLPTFHAVEQIHGGVNSGAIASAWSKSKVCATTSGPKAAR